VTDTTTQATPFDRPAGASPTQAAMPLSRLVRAYLVEAKYETIRLLREPSFAVTFLVLPLIFYLFFGVALIDLRGVPKMAAGLFLNWSVIAVAGPGLFGFGMVLASERDQGLLTLKRALPAPPAAYLLAKMVMAMFFAGLIMVTLSAAAFLFGHVRLATGSFLGVVGVNMFGALPFCAIGLFIGVRVHGKSAPAFVNLVYLPSMFLAQMFFPLPPSIRGFRFISPLYYLRTIAYDVAGITPHDPTTMFAHVGVLTGLTILLIAGSVRRLARVG
jgi:ABC-2 type transport system permease protein